MMTRPMPGWSFKVARSTEMDTSICPVRRSWALKLLPDTRPAYGSYLSQSISLVAPLNTPENVSSVRLMKGPTASRTNVLVEALWIWARRLRNDASGWAMNACSALSVRLPSYSGEKTIWPRTPVRSCSDDSSKKRLFPTGSGLSVVSQPTTVATSSSAVDGPVPIQSSTLKPNSEWRGSRIATARPSWPRYALTISATSRVGSRHTIPPVQRKQVDTTVETVLKPPEPAKTRPWVDPAGKAARS